MSSLTQDRLVVAVASSALFDLTDSDRVFREQGEEPYRTFQRANEHVPLAPGVAFPLIRRLLAVNGPTRDEQFVDVVLLSRNDPDTGLRVFNAIEHHKLPIQRAAFVKGRDPFVYVDAIKASLFLSANAADVQKAVAAGLPAGQVFPGSYPDDPDDHELRIAFDFDGILADDAAEQVYQAQGLAPYQVHERAHRHEPLDPGPLARFLTELAAVQRKDRARQEADPEYKPRIRIAIVTARGAPAHTRVITTLRHWGVQVDEGFFLGGLPKGPILARFRPHIFFDDQVGHITGASPETPSVHVPFGVTNRRAAETLPPTAPPASIADDASGPAVAVATAPTTTAPRSRGRRAPAAPRRR